MYASLPQFFMTPTKFILCQYAAVMGMNEDIKLVGNDFSNAATALYIATLVAEVPTGKWPLPSRLSHTNDYQYVRSLHPSKGPDRKMAWDECHFVGLSRHMHCRCK